MFSKGCIPWNKGKCMLDEDKKRERKLALQKYNNKTERRKHMKEYHKKNIKKALLLRDKNRYDGNREKVLLRDRYTCQDCGKTNYDVIIDVHHKDNKGRGVSENKRNNSIDNLITLCRSCHLKRHHPKGSKFNDYAVCKTIRALKQRIEELEKQRKR